MCDWQGKRSDNFSNISTILCPICWAHLHIDVTDRYHQCLSTSYATSESYWGFGDTIGFSSWTWSSQQPQPWWMLKAGSSWTAILILHRSWYLWGLLAWGCSCTTPCSLRQATVWDTDFFAFFFYLKLLRLWKETLKKVLCDETVFPSAPVGSAVGQFVLWVSLVQCVISKHHALGIQNWNRFYVITPKQVWGRARLVWVTTFSHVRTWDIVQSC